MEASYLKPSLFNMRTKKLLDVGLFVIVGVLALI